MADGVSTETQMSLAASSMFPGFRFAPTDVELISFYLKKKLEGDDKSCKHIAEVEICTYEPWDLPAKSFIDSKNEWFFYCARSRKYPNGSQSRRATEQGYWKATGKERSVKAGSNVIGTKRTLVFHIGRAPRGERTEWIMHEYCMDGQSQDSLVICRLRKNAEFHPTNNSYRRIQNRRQPSTMHDSNQPASEGGTELPEQTGIYEGDKGVESNSKKCCSSYDSHSIEQNDSTSEFTPAESCSQQKDSDDEDFFAGILNDDIIKLDETSLTETPDVFPEIAGTSQQKSEDFFAEILNDDIIKLDETSLTDTPDVFLDIAGTSQQKSEEMPSHVLPVQGTANRRIKLMIKEKSGLDEYSIEKNRSPKTQSSPTCLLGTFLPRTINIRLVYVAFITLTLLALFQSLQRGSKPVEDFQYTTFYKDM